MFYRHVTIRHKFSTWKCWFSTKTCFVWHVVKCPRTNLFQTTKNLPCLGWNAGIKHQSFLVYLIAFQGAMFFFPAQSWWFVNRWKKHGFVPGDPVFLGASLCTVHYMFCWYPNTCNVAHDVVMMAFVWLQSFWKRSLLIGRQDRLAGMSPALLWVHCGSCGALFILISWHNMVFRCDFSSVLIVLWDLNMLTVLFLLIWNVRIKNPQWFHWNHWNEGMMFSVEWGSQWLLQIKYLCVVWTFMLCVWSVTGLL